MSLVTLPARMQEVHTCSRRGLPPTMARTRWMLGFHRRFVRRCEWLTLIPNEGRFPQTSHTDAIEPGTSRDGGPPAPEGLGGVTRQEG